MAVDPAEHVAAHSAAAIRERLQGGPEHSYLRDFVYGAIDGAVTTFAVVSGVAGAELSSGVVLVLGFANLLADGFSMAAGNFLASRAEQQQRKRARLNEEREIDLYPEGEIEEVRQILKSKGLHGEVLEQTVQIITADRSRWVDLMLVDELGLTLHGSHPLRAAASTFVAFVTVGFVPLFAFVLQYADVELPNSPFLWSSLLTAAAFFAVGTAKARFVEQRWYFSGMETLLVGGSAAAVSYFVGMLLKGLA
jgi:VIT1/CCC1 family predicted Fe2+/Mn2+ transporter